MAKSNPRLEIHRLKFGEFIADDVGPAFIKNDLAGLNIPLPRTDVGTVQNGGQSLRLPARSPACVFHQIEGCADVAVEGATPFKLAEADTCCAPGYTAVTLTNRSASAPAFVFMADESPFHRKLGVYEVR